MTEGHPRFISVQFIAFLVLAICPCSTSGQESSSQLRAAKIQCEKPNTTSAKTKGSKPRAVPLPEVIAQVQKAIQCYQEDRPSGLDSLPDLESAELDFKVVNDLKLGGTLSVLVFKIGATALDETTDDITYKYALTPPKPADRGPFSASTSSPVLIFEDELANTIVQAAEAIKEQRKIGQTVFPATYRHITICRSAGRQSWIDVSDPIGNRRPLS